MQTTQLSDICSKKKCTFSLFPDNVDIRKPVIILSLTTQLVINNKHLWKERHSLSSGETAVSQPAAESPPHTTTGHQGALTRPDTSQCRPPNVLLSPRSGMGVSGGRRSLQTPRGRGWLPRPRGPRKAAEGAIRSLPVKRPESGRSQLTSRDSWVQQSRPAVPALRRRGSGEAVSETGRGRTPDPATSGTALGQLLGWEGHLSPRRPGSSSSQPLPTPTQRGPAQHQRGGPVLPEEHTPEEGGGAPQMQPGPLLLATLQARPSLRNPTCQGEGRPYLWETLALWPLGQPHDPVRLTCRGTEVCETARGSCLQLQSCYRGGVQSGNFLCCCDRRYRHRPAHARWCGNAA